MDDKVFDFILDGSVDNYFKLFDKIRILLDDDISFYVAPVRGYCSKCDEEFLIARIILDIDEE